MLFFHLFRMRSILLLTSTSVWTHLVNTEITKSNNLPSKMICLWRPVMNWSRGQSDSVYFGLFLFYFRLLLNARDKASYTLIIWHDVRILLSTSFNSQWVSSALWHFFLQQTSIGFHEWRKLHWRRYYNMTL